MDELRRMADDTQPDIIEITEAWTKPQMGDAEFGLAGYKMFRKDSLVERGGGWAGFSEAVWCNLELQGSKIIVGVVYRCPSISKDEDTRLHKVITHASRGECLIMGDNVLDLILSSNKELVDNVTVVEPLGTNDHSQIHFSLIVKTGSRYSKQRKRDFKKGDYVQMRSYLENMK